MKFTSIAFFATILAESSAAEQIRGSVERSLKEEICTFMMREDLMELSTLEKGVGHDESNYECERNDGTTLPLIMDKAQQQLLTMMVEDGNVIPGEATFESLGATVTSNGLVVQHGVEINFEKKSERTSRNRRKLVTKSGDTYYLVVRVIDINGLAHPHSTVTMSDNMFGTINDPVNMKSQIYDCSAGALNIVPGYPDSATEAQKVNIDAVTVDLEHPTGFMEANINIDITTASSRYDVRNAIITKVNELLGFTLPGPFDHVVFNIEKCYLDCGWAAYAYINSWNQVYQGNYYLQTGVQVHEYGHNLGMAHSGGLNGQTYTDHTCMMGNPLYSDDVGRMCYNPAKSYYIGWYSEGIVDFDPSVEDQWSGTLMGVGQWKDYNSNERPHPVVVKIETGTSTDYFVGFNRAAGANADNDEADDLVTIIETGNNGESYSQSFLKGYIGTGQAYTFPNWQDSGQDLVIYVESIDITSNPGTAQVTISIDGTQVPTAAPTPLAGCNQDTVLVDLTTDNYPQETSWQVKNSSGDVVFSREGYTDANTAHQYVDCHDACGGEFVISDTYGDGFCCGYGSGSYSVTVNGQAVVVDGGSFGTSETTSIDCATNPTPAPIPTSAPVEPTSAPVEPTSAPVEPTLAPVEPTSAPVEPTLAPVEPTSAPVEPTLAPVEPTVVVFPQTYYFPQIQTNQFVHGICVKSTSSSSNIRAESTDPDLQYALINNMASGVKAWNDRDYTIIGVEDSPCAGSTFLQPSLHKSINRNSEMSVFVDLEEVLAIAEICIFVESSNRDGGYRNRLMQLDERFIDYGTNTGLAWKFSNRNRSSPFHVFCREIPDQPTAAPTVGPTLAPVLAEDLLEIDLPESQTNKLVHGICVSNSRIAQAFTNNDAGTQSGLTYTAVLPFTGNQLAWDDRQYKMTNYAGSPCFEGTFLRPSRHKSIRKGTGISIKAIRATPNELMELCVFFETDHNQRSGKFDTTLPDLGFTDNGTPGIGWNNNELRLFCKEF